MFAGRKKENKTREREKKNNYYLQIIKVTKI